MTAICWKTTKFITLKRLLLQCLKAGTKWDELIAFQCESEKLLNLTLDLKCNEVAAQRKGGVPLTRNRTTRSTGKCRHR